MNIRALTAESWETPTLFFFLSIGSLAFGPDECFRRPFRMCVIASRRIPFCKVFYVVVSLDGAKGFWEIR